MEWVYGFYMIFTISIFVWFIVSGFLALLPLRKSVAGEIKLFDKRMCFVQNLSRGSSGHLHVVLTEERLITLTFIAAASVAKRSGLLLTISENNIQSVRSDLTGKGRDRIIIQTLSDKISIQCQGAFKMLEPLQKILNKSKNQIEFTS